MLTRSQLRHTSIGNGFAPLFEPSLREATRKVLMDEAGSDEYLGIREKLDRWPAVRREVEANLRGFAEDYTPFFEGLETLRAKMKPEVWMKVSSCHRRRVRELQRLDKFVAAVTLALVGFEEGLRDARKGVMSMEKLSDLHEELMDAYRIS